MKGIHEHDNTFPEHGSGLPEHGQGRGRFNRGKGRRGPHGHGGPGFGPGGFGPGFGPGGFGPGGFGPRGFGPGGGRRANRGDVRAAILSLLAESPSNGYGLIRTIAEKTSGTWRPSPGSVYPTLQQLVDEELITAVGEGRRTEFTLTDDGRAYVAEHEEELANAWNTEADGNMQEFHQSIGKLMGVVHQFRAAATDEQRRAAIEKLDETRRALYLILAD
ncbi:PadR family transcriptional regulator [Paenarthrobacter sp. RAF54_2]|uniref:PadR family transcriptional regulator n=1 Tax=unclassified Paenarthrobacter TaxID=2634190 RepID=UPI003F973826